MDTTRPIDGETVWIEYPEGKHVEAMYHASSDCYIPKDGPMIEAARVANWSRNEHEDTDISDDPKQAIKGKLTRD